MVTTLPSIPSSESVHLHHFKRRGHDDSSGLSPVGTDDSDEADEYETKAPSGAWRRQLSPCSVFSAASSGRLYAEPAQTLIFLDWDDTIFPCTEIFTTRNYTRRSREWTKPLPPDLDEELSAWRQAAGDFLQAACAISDRCVILTNSRPPWVSACIDHFAPNLKEILAKNGPVRVVYASEMMKKSKSKSDEISEKAEGVIIKMLQSLGCFHGFVSKMVESMAAMRQNAPKPHFDLTEAKFKAMRKEAESFYSQYQGQTWKNIISLGDMAYEHDAAKSLSSTRGKLRCHWQLLSARCPALDVVQALLQWIYTGKMDLKLVHGREAEISSDRVAQLAQLLGMRDLVAMRQRLVRSWRREPSRGCIEPDLLRAYDQRSLSNTWFLCDAEGDGNLGINADKL
eukprot:g20258.t1